MDKAGACGLRMLEEVHGWSRSLWSRESNNTMSMGQELVDFRRYN